MRRFSKQFVCAALLTACSTICLASAIDQRVQHGPTFHLAPDSPRYVRRAVDDLKAQLRSARGGATEGRLAEVRTTLSDGDDLSEEGYHLKLAAGSLHVTARTWRGMNYGLLESVKLLAASPDGATLPARLDVRANPRFNYRAMYAHTAWVYHAPFALRSWNESDWKRYVDLLAYMNVNVLQIWNLISIMPQPLGADDAAYLRMFGEVVRYAMEERGFRAVWLGDAANNVALPSHVPIKRREYYVVHSLKDPGDPRQLAEIAAAREPLYSLVPNASGYWIIDSDPGNWPGSPSTDFVKLLAENRRLISAKTEKKNDAELIYWIWHGWGIKSKAEDLTTILKGLEGINNYALLACFPEDLQLIEDFKLTARTTWFPYGAIEGEPSSPYTALRFTEIRKAFEVTGRYPQLRGVMGNAQTPLVQLPNLWLFHRAAWDRAYGQKSDAEILRDLAGQIFPRHAEAIAEGWRQLALGDAAAAQTTADRLERAARGGTLGPAGAIGRHIAADNRWLIINIVAQLRQHAVATEFVQSLQEGAPLGKVQALARRYFDAAASMQTTTGFRPALDKKGRNLLPFFNWYYPNRDYALIRAAWGRYEQARPREAARVHAFLKRHSLSAPAGTSAAEMVEFLVGQPPRRDPSFKYAN